MKPTVKASDIGLLGRHEALPTPEEILARFQAYYGGAADRAKRREAAEAQVRAADEKTRLNWIKLAGPDATVRMTLADAMVKSATECHHFWIWTASQDIDMSSSVGHASPARGGGAGNNLPQGREAGGAPKTGRKAKGQVLCKKRNDARGCKAPCPDKRLHGCDVLVADNECCGKTHKRADCPHAAASPQ